MGADRWGPPPIKKNSIFLGKNSHFFRVFFRFQLCRVSALGKDVFADSFFAECSLPSAALGKAFAECKLGFAECPWHSANSLSPVVVKPFYKPGLKWTRSRKKPVFLASPALASPMKPFWMSRAKGGFSYMVFKYAEGREFRRPEVPTFNGSSDAPQHHCNLVTVGAV